MRNSLLALLCLVAVSATLNTAEACHHRAKRHCGHVRSYPTTQVIYEAPVSYVSTIDYEVPVITSSSYMSSYVPGPDVIRAVDVATGQVIFDRSQGIAPIAPQRRPVSQQRPMVAPVSTQPQIAPPPVAPPPPAPSDLYSTPRPGSDQMYQAPKPY